MKMTKQVVVPLVAILLFASFAVAGAGILVSNHLTSDNTVTQVPVGVSFNPGTQYTYDSGNLVMLANYTMGIDVTSDTDVAAVQLIFDITDTGIEAANVTLYYQGSPLTAYDGGDNITYTIDIPDIAAGTPQTIDLTIMYNLEGTYHLDISAWGWTA
jgi:hypothetical protein